MNLRHRNGKMNVKKMPAAAKELNGDVPSPPIGDGRETGMYFVQVTNFRPLDTEIFFSVTTPARPPQGLARMSEKRVSKRALL